MTRNILFLLAFLVFAAAPVAFAQETWFGEVLIRIVHRGQVSQWRYNGEPLAVNLASYSDYSVRFEFYKQGVTDRQDVVIWQNINAQVELIADVDGRLLSKGWAQVTGRNNNNAAYLINLGGIKPETVGKLDPELENYGTLKAHLNIIMDGVQYLSVPVIYRYQP